MASTKSISNVQLPGELTEQILSAYVDEFDDDPALQWTLRHLSGNQMHRIERRFRDFWLPKLVVTVYSGSWLSEDYKLVDLESSSSDLDTAHFELEGSNSKGGGRIRGDILKKVWHDYSFQNSTVHLRLGEGVLNDGFAGAYIINDTEVSGLQVDKDAMHIRFDWRKTFDALLREETMMRRVHDNLLTPKIQEWKTTMNRPASSPVPSHVELELLINDVQMGRRVAVKQHRFRRHDPTGATQPRWMEESAHFHGQKPTYTENRHVGGCFCCSRVSGPDIFEVIHQEESMVPLLPAWKSGNLSEIYDLYAEEFGWACCLIQGKMGDRDFFLSRKDGWKGSVKRPDEIKKSLRPRRWDTLG